jgi:hypothetical protein
VTWLRRTAIPVVLTGLADVVLFAMLFLIPVSFKTKPVTPPSPPGWS